MAEDSLQGLINTSADYGSMERFEFHLVKSVVLDQVCYLIVSISDLCTLTYFVVKIDPYSDVRTMYGLSRVNPSK